MGSSRRRATIAVMQCPFCEERETRVVDSRVVDDGAQVRRRRECTGCGERFTTYETAELAAPRVIKNDGSRVPFDERKLRSGMLRALEKRPVSSAATSKRSMSRTSRSPAFQAKRTRSTSTVGGLAASVPFGAVAPASAFAGRASAFIGSFTAAVTAVARDDPAVSARDR